jgi:hypothetical protein
MQACRNGIDVIQSRIRKKKSHIMVTFFEPGKGPWLPEELLAVLLASG